MVWTMKLKSYKQQYFYTLFMFIHVKDTFLGNRQKRIVYQTKE